MAYVLILLGLGVIGVAFAAFIQGQLRWARIPSRKAAGVIMLVGVGVGVFGISGVLTPQPPSDIAANNQTAPAQSAPPATSTIATTPAPKTNAIPSSKTPEGAGGNTGAAPRPADSSVWDALAQCESGGDWAINTGNGLYGGLQLDRGAWLSNGGTAYAPLPNNATREQQILIAEKVRVDRGFSPWSSCARKLGLR